MSEKEQTFYWFIESADTTINVSVIYETLKQMNLAVETVEFPDPEYPKDPTKRHYTVEVKFKLIKMIASKKFDLKGMPYHIWRKKGRDGEPKMVDNIFKRKLSAKAKEARKRLTDRKKQFPYDSSRKPPPPNLPKQY